MQGSIRVEWPGWTDTPSGIKGYELEIFKMQAYGDELAVPTNYLLSIKLNQTVTHFDVELTDPGVSLKNVLKKKRNIFVKLYSLLTIFYK